MLGNIFGFFVKNRKGGRKVFSMQGCFENFGARSNFAPKDVQNYFSKDFHARKYFWIFVKERKSARKVSRMHGCFRKFKHAVGKIEKKIEKSKNGGK